MAYRIKYFLHGKFMDTFLGSDTLSATRANAVAGMVLHRATSATILDMGHGDKVVETMTR